ncbi:MAG: dehydrogenase [Acidobacteria bacterium 13_1_20CM_3_53_8]|nr:MAG: dehydrogenase [Acidobacteria bacterium 13_1_20CM_3_53_8]
MSARIVKPGAIGQPFSRVDGRLKVTGKATFAAEYKVENVAHGALVFSQIARGKIKNIETSAARNAPGVILVLTHENAPEMKKTPVFGSDSEEMGAASSSILYLNTDEVYFNGQPVAVVVAETLEQAEHAATLVAVEYEEKQAKLILQAEKPDAVLPEHIPGEPSDLKQGDAEGALAEALYKVDNIYTTPPFNHNAIELHATLAEWSEDEKSLTVYDSTQYVIGVQEMLAKKFSLRKENVRVIGSFVGGGFGGKGNAWAHVSLTVAAAKVVKRPVKLVLSREGVHLSVGGRTPTEQRVALAANDVGKLTALIHTGFTQTTEHNNFAEQFTFPARHLYKSENIWLRQEMVHLDIVPNTFMRAPGESPGTFALESAIDELAHEMGIDPIELRARNEPDRDPVKDLPFSMRNIKEAYRVGAEMFGWSKRHAAPRTMRDGRFLIGCGVATAFYPAYQFPAAARVEIHADGTAIAQSAMHEMGMGSATAQAQNLADELGLSFEQVRFEYGDSNFPYAPVAGGSNSTISVGAAVKAACDDAKKKIHGLVGEDDASPLKGTRFDEVEFREGGIYRRDDATKGETFHAILRRFEEDKIEGEGEAAPGAESEKYSMGSYGALFCEVRVDEETGEVRVSRFLGVYDCGKIINPKTASSQWRGGITMGIGMALTEEALFDVRKGRIVNPSLAEYHLPVNLDVPNIEIHFLDIPDPLTPMGAHGVGEIGITGVAAAVANAVFNATGKRIRDLPITLDKLL